MAQRAPVHSPGRIGHVKTWPVISPVRPSAGERGYGGERWEWLRKQAYVRDGGHCCVCGKLCIDACGKDREKVDWRDVAQCDHIIPKSQGGPDELDNLQTLCGSCHTVKTNREKGRKARD